MVNQTTTKPATLEGRLRTTDTADVQTFPGKIGFPGDSATDIAAVITVGDASLEITTGETSIGEWPISDITLELGVRGYVVTLDGEELVLAPHDRFGFSQAVEEAQEHTSLKVGRRAARKMAKKTAKANKALATSSKVDDRAQPIQETPPTHETPPTKGTPPTQETPPTQKRPTQKTPIQEKEPAAPSTPDDKATTKKPKARRTTKVKFPRPRRAQADQGPPKAPHVPGLDDPDKDALWATNRTQEPASIRERLNGENGARNLAYVGAGGLLIAAYFAPAVVSFLLLIPGVAAVVAAGLALLDPSFTRLLPGWLSEIRLMLIGLGFFGASLIVASVF